MFATLPVSLYPDLQVGCFPSTATASLYARGEIQEGWQDRLLLAGRQPCGQSTPRGAQPYLHHHVERGLVMIGKMSAAFLPAGASVVSLTVSIFRMMGKSGISDMIGLTETCVHSLGSISGWSGAVFGCCCSCVPSAEKGSSAWMSFKSFAFDHDALLGPTRMGKGLLGLGLAWSLHLSLSD